MKYYKVDIYSMTTLYNFETQDWSGKSFDNGIIETICKKDLNDLLDHLKIYGFENAEHFEDNRYDVNYIENHDLIDLSFYFYEVYENAIELKKAV